MSETCTAVNVDILDVPHKILYVSREMLLALMKLNDDMHPLGMYDHINSYIYINNELKKELLQMAIIHEVTHALLFLRGQQDVTMTEEEICRFVPSVFYIIHNILREIEHEMGLIQCSDNI